nr:reverse transcriptase domain-containing protein [Tanacetum cinerariifolium]
MNFKLTDRSISHPVVVVEDVFFKVGTFHFSADFVVVDFDADPHVPLILGRSFFKTERAIIDVFKEVLSFSDVIMSVKPTPYYDLIVSTSSPTLTPFRNSDYLLEEVDAFLALEDDPTSPKVNHSYVDTEGDILLLEAFLNDDPSLPPPNQGNYLPQVPLADLSASINLMPLSVWNKISLPDLSPTCMNFKLTDRSISHPVVVVEDVFFKVGTFHFSADFVVVDFDADPHVPLILGRSFFKTERAIIDVFKGELTLRVGKEAITFNLDQTLRYSANYNDMTSN